MKPRYKTLYLAVFIIVSILFTACDNSDKLQDEMTPEKFIQDMFLELADETISIKDTYIDKFSLNSSKCITLDEYTALFDGVKILGASDISSKLIDYPGDPVYEVNYDLSYEIDGVQNSIAITDYVIYTFKNYKYLYKGYLTRKYYNMSQTDSTNEIHSNSISIYNSVNGKEIEIVMANDTEDNYSLGKDNGLKMIIKTDVGLLMQTAEAPVLLKPGKSESVTLRFEEPFNEVGRINVSRIYKLDEQGNFISTGDGIEYTVRVSK